MRAIVLLAALAACGKKTPVETPAPAPAAPAPVHTPVAAPAPADAAQREPEAPANNANFTAAITWADGTNTKGHVVRVERSEDWFGESWTTAPGKLKVDLENDGGTGLSAAWPEVKDVSVTYLAKTDIDCDMDSSYTPAMYQCTLKTDTSVTTQDGKEWNAADRHKWRFVFESGDTAEFWIWKLPARRQEESVPDPGAAGDNVKLQTELQAELMQAKTGKVLKSLHVTP